MKDGPLGPWRHLSVVPALLNRESWVQSSGPRTSFRIPFAGSVPFPDLGVLPLLHFNIA